MEEVIENNDSQNVELEHTDSQNSEESVEEVTEETTEETTETEDEKYTESEKQLYARLKKAEAKVKELEEKAPNTEATDPDRIDRLELKADGFTEKEDQDFILRVAKAEGVVPSEAAKLDYVTAKLDHNKRLRNSEKATPRSNNRTGGTVDEVALAVRKYKQTGELPESNALTSKVLDALKNGA